MFKTNIRELTLRYIVALSLMAILSSTAYSLIRIVLHKQESDAPVINLSGRQRMLSQKLTKEVLLLVQPSVITDRMDDRQQLENTLQQWVRVHLGLIHGDETLKLHGDNSEEVIQLFREIDPYFRLIRTSVEDLLKMDMKTLERLTIDSPLVQNVLMASPIFLEIMDKIVFQYDKEARVRVEQLKKYETFIVTAVLILLVLEALVIFRPMVNKVKRNFQALSEMNAKLQKEIYVRKKAEEELQKAHQDLELKVIERTRELQEEIAERKLVEKALREKEMRLRAITQSANDAIITADTQGKIISWNKGAKQIFGYEEKEVLGKSLTILMPQRYRERHQKGLDRISKGGKYKVIGKTLELEGLKKDGTEFPIELSLATWKVGDQVYFTGIIRDITERKRAEEALRKAKEVAEAASRAKSEFLANMSHEIRTPMNGILGMTELALETDLQPQQREYLELVKQSAENLLMIINDILDFSKIEAGKLDLVEEPFDLRETIGETLKTLSFRASQKELELVYWIDPQIPEWVVGDAGRLRQVLVNLVGNAIKFTDVGQILVRVFEQKSETAGQSDTRTWLHFQVIDTGIGIPEDKQEKIFEVFTQADGSTTRKYGGTGLGLAISRQLVELMGGRMWVESPLPEEIVHFIQTDQQVGMGSVFHFTVRFAIAEPSLQKPSLQQVESLKGLPVLVVDDNVINRRLLEQMLLGWEMNPTVVASADEALTQLSAAPRRFRLIITDGQMPEIDGFEFVERVRRMRNGKNLPVIMLTSGGRPEDLARCRTLSINAYLIKPVTASELLDVILRALIESSERKRPASRKPRTSRTHSQDSARPLEGVKILLAEDNAVNQKLAVRLLQKLGCSVIVANNGNEAVQLWRNQNVDLILMDVQMPEMDGFEATAEIRRLEKSTGQHTPIIALTAHAMKGDREKCLDAGMDGYVTKPIRREELENEIRRFVSVDKKAVGVHH
ncbi:MAG: response regulator [Calditrichaeota bacterium]|nr:response regulator [Calditrichota bacterium]